MVLCLTITLMGCSTAWIGQAEEVVAALIPAATNIVALVAALQGKSVSAADLQTAEGLLLCIEELDLSQPADKIRAKSDAFCRTAPGFRPIADFQAELAKKMGLNRS